MADFFAELKRRHIYRVAAAYAVVAWVLLQLVDNVAPILELPPWVARTILLLLVIGFPVALVFAWVHQLGQATIGAPGRVTTSRLDWVLAGGLAAVIAIFIYQQVTTAAGSRAVQQATVAASSQPRPEGISIAVLPFVNLSGDAGQEFLSDGMTEEITAALAQVPGLRVLGRTSAFAFKGQNKDLRTIGQALGATHLIEGSLRKAGNRVRITAQLVRAEDDSHLWVQNYDRELTDVFAIQEDIAQAIAISLRVPLGLQQGESLVRDRTKDLESYQQYLHARALVRARGPWIAEAIAILEPLVARDPSFAPAWAMLGYAYLLEAQAATLLEAQTATPISGEEVRQLLTDKAGKAAQEAIRLDSRTAIGYSVLANIQTFGGKWAAAEDLYHQAIALDPNDADVLQRYSLTLVVTGRVRGALSLREKLRTLEPFVPVYNIFSGFILRLNGQNQAAVSILDGLPVEAAADFFPHLIRAQAYAAEGRYGEAADTLLAVKGNEVSRQSIEDAAALLRSAPQIVKSSETLPQLEAGLVFVYTYFGATSRILDVAEPRMERGLLMGPTLSALWGPEFAVMRKTERFKALVRKAGLVDYWRERGWPDHCRPIGADDFVCD